MIRKLPRIVLAFAMLLLAVATGLGAYASHGLSLEPHALESFWIGIDFQFFHALGLLALALVIERRPEARILAAATVAIAVGIVFFSSGVYASSLGGPAWIVTFAPVGGVTLIVGWLVAAVGALAPSAGSA